MIYQMRDQDFEPDDDQDQPTGDFDFVFKEMTKAFPKFIADI